MGDYETEKAVNAILADHRIDQAYCRAHTRNGQITRDGKKLRTYGLEGFLKRVDMGDCWTIVGEGLTGPAAYNAFNKQLVQADQAGTLLFRRGARGAGICGLA